MWGGPAQQETWDLKPDAPAEIRGEFRPIATRVPGIEISEHFPQLAERTDRLAIVRSMTHTNVDHLTATSFLLTGERRPPTASSQAIGRTSAPCCRDWGVVAGHCRRLSRCGRSSKTRCRAWSSSATVNLPAGWGRASTR